MIQPLTDDELRETLHQSIGIIDGYVKALQNKDIVILRYSKYIEELEEELRKAKAALFPELPTTAEVSE